MIPLSLTIKGLYSYQQEQTIDFRPLVEGQLFGIFGSVGSGKSSILEAITFALYGESDRLNQRDNRNYNMMNLKSKELKIDFTFRNHDDKEYRFVVNGKRSGTQFDTVRTLQRKAYRKGSNDWIPLEVSSAEDIIGLSYNNFRRTMIIPQGKFQEFLQLGDKDRTYMMKELFNLDKFEFYPQTASLEKRNNERISNLEGQLSHYEQTTEEVLKEKSRELNELRQKLKDHESKLKKKQDEEQLMIRLKEQFDEMNRKKKVYHALLEQKDNFKKREEKLKKYQLCERLFKSLLERLAETEKSLNDKQQKQAKLRGELNTYKGQLSRKQKEYEEVEAAYKKLDQKKSERDDYGRMVQLIEMEEKLTHLENRIKNGEKEVDGVKKQKEQLEKELEGIDASLENLKQALPDQNRLTQLKTWFTQKNTLLSRKNELQQEQEGVQKQLLETEKNLEKAIPDKIKQQTGAMEYANPDKVLEQLEAISADVEKSIETIDQEIADLQVQHKLDEFTDTLRKGEPCPLCGSKEHPRILNVEAVDEQLEKAKEKQKSLKKDHKLITNAISDAKQIYTNKLYKQETLNQSLKKLAETEKQLNDHLKAFTWQNYDPENESLVDEQLQKATALHKEIRGLEATRKEKEAKLKDVDKDINRYEQGLQKLKNDKISLEGERKSLKNAFVILDPDKESLGKDQAGREKQGLEQAIQQTEKTYTHLEKELKRLNDEILKLETTLDHLHNDLENLSAQLDQISRQLTGQLESSGFTDLEEVKRILEQEIDTEKEVKALEQYNRDLYAAQKDYESVQQQLTGKSFDPEAHKQLQEEVKNLKQQDSELRETHTTLKNRVAQMEKDLKDKAEMQKQLEELRKRAENLATMKKLFKGSGFVNYISSVYLQNLCEAANERFYKLTRQHLQLEVDENNNFRVRDFLNNGRVRSVKTLSGGQTFQASLSLALALAESVQQQNKAEQNFFFLDEGFGTLDREALQTVFDTLKSLRNENRVVGVISHVDELQQEIDMFIRVENHPEKGSVIRLSWL